MNLIRFSEYGASCSVVTERLKTDTVTGELRIMTELSGSKISWPGQHLIPRPVGVWVTYQPLHDVIKLQVLILCKFRALLLVSLSFFHFVTHFPPRSTCPCRLGTVCTRSSLCDVKENFISRIVTHFPPRLPFLLWNPSLSFQDEELACRKFLGMRLCYFCLPAQLLCVSMQFARHFIGIRLCVLTVTTADKWSTSQFDLRINVLYRIIGILGTYC